MAYFSKITVRKLGRKILILALIGIIAMQPVMSYVTRDNKENGTETIDITEILNMINQQLSKGLNEETRLPNSRLNDKVKQATGAPSLISPPNGAVLTDTTPTFEWTSVSGAFFYELQIDTSSSFSSPQQYSVASTSFTLSSPLSQGKYYWRVRASMIGLKLNVENGDRDSETQEINPWSTTWSFTISVDPLAPPSLQTPSNGMVTNDATPTFTWSSVSGATAYQIQVSSSLSYDVLYIDQVITGTSYTPSSNLNDRKYYWRVRTKNDAGVWGSWSTSYSFTIDTVGPDPPTNLSPAEGDSFNDFSVVFSWDGPTDATKYWLTVIDITNEPTDVYDGYVYSESKTVNVGHEGTFMWRVASIDAVGNQGSFTSYITFYTDTTPPGRPGLISPGNGATVADTTPTFKWGTVSEATLYQIQVALSSDFSPDMIVLDDTTTSTTYTPTTQLPQGEVYWKVRARDSAGNWGSWSLIWSLTVDTVPPGVPQLSSPTDNSRINDPTPTLTWQAPSGFPDGYHIQIAVDSSFSMIIVDAYPSLTTYTVGGSLNEQTYYWRVKAKDSVDNWGDWSETWSFTIDTTPPGTPTLISPADNSVTNDPTPTFSWTAVTGAVRYEIEISEFENPSPVVSVTTTATSYTLSSSLSEGGYTWHVRAQDSAGNWGSWSTYRLFSLDLTPPSAPSLISPLDGSATSDNTPLFKWSSISDATTYRLQVSNTYDFFDIITIDITTSGTSYTPTDPIADGQWYYRVKARDAAGNWGGWSMVADFTIDTTGPSAPTLLSPDNNYIINDPTPLLDWSTPAGNPAEYHFQVALDPGFSNLYLNGTVSYSEYQVLGSMNEDEYYWRVRAIDDLGNVGSWSEVWSFVIDLTPPVAPNLVSPTNGTYTNDNTPTFDWDIVSDASHYDLYIYRFGYSSPYYTTTVGSSIFTLTSALLDNHYIWKVRAIDSAGNVGPWSEEWHLFIDTVAPNPPSLISPFDGTYTANNKPKFVWSQVFDAVQYELQVSYLSDFSLITIDQFLTSTVYTVTNGIADGTWYWRTRCKDQSQNWSAWSDVYTLTIDTEGPSPPDLYTPSDGAITNDSSPSLSWESVSDAVQYLVQLSTTSSFTTLLWNATTSSTVFNGGSLSDGVYYWKIKAKDSLGNWGDWSVTFSFTVDCTPPAQPTVTSPSNNQYYNTADVNITWNPVSDAVQYHLQVYREGEGTPFVDVLLTTTEYSLENLSDGSYHLAVAAKDDAQNWGPYSDIIYFYVDTVAPEQVSLTSPANDTVFTTSSVDLEWQSVTDAYYYQIYVSTTPDFDTVWIFNSFDSSYTLNSLSDDVYYWKVRALDRAYNYGNWSTVNYFIVDAVPPNSPSPVAPAQGSTVSDPYPDFSWTEIADAELYHLQVSTSSSFDGLLIIDVNVSSTTYTSTVFFSNTHYYWRVAALDHWNVSSSWSTVYTFNVNYGPLSAPVLLTPNDGSATNALPVVFDWQDVSGAIQYEIQVDINIDFAHPFIDEIISDSIYSFSDALPQNDPIYWRVRAIDQYNLPGLWSSNYVFEYDITPPSVPVLLSPDNGSMLNDTTVLLKWQAVDDAVVYEVQIIDASTEHVLYDTNIADTELQLTLGDGVYRWLVRAKDNANNIGNWSDSYYFEIDATDPSVVPNVDSLTYEYGSTGNSISWTVSDLHLSYYTVSLNGTIITTNNVTADTTIALNIDGLDVGNYQYIITVYDSFGNFASSEIVVHVVDTTAPSVTPNTDAYTYEFGTTNNELSWAITELSLYSYTIYFDGTEIFHEDALSGEQTVNVNVDGLGVGIYNYTIIVEDIHGNSASSEITVEVVDTTAPAVTPVIDSLTYEYGTIGNEISWSVSDLRLSFYTLSLNSSIISEDNITTDTTLTFNVDSLAVGFYVYCITVVDLSGNSASSEITVHVVDSTTPSITPSVTALTYEFGTSNNELSWTITDLSLYSFTVYLDGTEISHQESLTGEHTVNVNVNGLGVGIYNYTIVVEDIHGNFASSKIFVEVVDTTAPAVTPVIDSLTYEYGTTGNEISWTLNDLSLYSYNVSLDGISILDDNEVSGEHVVTVNVDGLAVGTHIYRIVVEDLYGNMASSTITVEVIDSASPIITNVFYSPSEPTDTDTIIVSANATDNVGIEAVYFYYSVNGGTFTHITMQKNSDHFTVEIGPFNAGDTIDFYVQAVDTSGNIAEADTIRITIQNSNTETTETTETTQTTQTSQTTTQSSPISIIGIIFSIASLGVILTVLRRKRK